MNSYELAAMHEKLALNLPGMAARLGRSLSAGAGRGAMSGAGLGAAAGAAGEVVADHEGMSAKEILGRGAARAMLGGAAGGLLGAASGGAGRVVRDARLLRPNEGTLSAVGKHVGGGLSAGAKRLGYTLTGKGDPHSFGVSSSTTAEKKINLLRLRAADELAANPSNAKKIHSGLAADSRSERLRGVIGDHAIDTGTSTLPGVVKGLVKDPRGTGRALMTQMRAGGGSGMAMLGVGLPLAVGAGDIALKGDESAQGGLTRTQKAVRALGTAGSTALTAGMPFIGGAVVGMGMDGLVHRATGGPRRPLPQVPSNP